MLSSWIPAALILALQIGGAPAATQKTGTPPQSQQRAVKTCPDGSVIFVTERCIEFPDHRKLYSSAPAVAIHTIEWVCGQRHAMAQIRVVNQPYANERGEHFSRYRFKVELTRLTVAGQPPSPESIGRVQAALSSLNSVSQLYGRCFFDNVPELNLVGHAPQEERYEERSARIRLD